MTEFESADNFFQELQRVLSNLKKRPADRVFAPDYVIKKRIYVNNLHENFLACHKLIVKPSELESAIDWGFAEKNLIDNINEILDSIQESIDQKTVPEEETQSDVDPEIQSDDDQKDTLNNSTMANFTFETRLKLPTLTDDKDEFSLRDFLDTIQSYHDTLNPEYCKKNR